MSPANYRVWICSVNVIMILLQLLFLHLFWRTSCEPQVMLLPVGEVTSLLVAQFATIGMQFFACLCGLVGVLISARHLVRLYWLLTVPLILLDTMQALIWTLAFNELHRHINVYLGSILAANEGHASLVGLCRVWAEFQDANSCCAPGAVLTSCATNCDSEKIHCTYSLLEWLHFRADAMAFVLYFLLYPMKLMVVFVLREDVIQLVSEIIYSNRKCEYLATVHEFEDDLENLNDDSHSSHYETLNFKTVSVSPL